MKKQFNTVFLVLAFGLIYVLNASSDWPIVHVSGIRIVEYVDLAAIIQSGNLCSGKLVAWEILNLLKPLSETCGEFLYGRPLLALLALSSIPIAWSTPLAIFIGLTTAVFIAVFIGVVRTNRGSFTVATVAVFSPGIFLLFERANFDLFILMGIFASACMFMTGRFFTGLFIIGVTALLKFYTVPLLLLSTILFGKSKGQTATGLAIAVPISIYALWDFSQLTALPGSGYAQFGSTVFQHYFSHIGLVVPSFLTVGFGFAVPLMVAFWVFRFTVKKGSSLILGSWLTFPDISKSVPCISVSVVFSSCYFAGLNYDYRLVFLAIAGVALAQVATGPKVNLYLLNTSLLVALWGSAAFGNGLDFGSDQLRFLVVGIFQFAGDTMVVIWTGLLFGLVAKLIVGSNLIRKLALRGVSL